MKRTLIIIASAAALTASAVILLRRRTGFDTSRVLWYNKKKTDDDEIKKIFFNRAEVKDAERICCENCFEQVVFTLRDKDHDFSIGLTTILECLAFAITQGELPKLPRSWCSDAEHCLRIAFDDEISYYDYNTFKERQD